jgi:hypothetical protein
MVPVPIGCFPGSFDPPTVAHVAIAEAAVARAGLDRLDLVLSREALGKEGRHRSPVSARAAALEAMGLSVRVTDKRLVAEIAEGYDVLVVGADKYLQLLDPAWYPTPEAHAGALAALPRVLVAPRAGVVLPDGVDVLDVHPDHHHVSSTAVVDGREEWRATPR